MTCEKCQTPLSDTERHMLMDSGPEVRVLCDTCRREAVQVEMQKLQQKMEGGLRYDHGKLRFDLLPPDALAELVAVYTMGAVKYEDHNWCKGMSWGRVLGSLLRHVFAWMGGEDRDKESGLHHMAHAAWNCVTLIAYAKRGVGQDDRYFTGGCR